MERRAEIRWRRGWGPALRPLIGAFFGHRHRRPRRRFGSAAAPAAEGPGAQPTL